MPVVSNVTASLYPPNGDADDDTTVPLNIVEQLLVQQVTATVRWHESVCFGLEAFSTPHNLEEGVVVPPLFVELGPGKVLTNLVRRTLPPGYKTREPKQSFACGVGDEASLGKFLADDAAKAVLF